MKKFIGLLAGILSLSSAYALNITSDVNGPVTISEPQLQVGSAAPQVSLKTANFKAQSVGGATGKVQIISTIESYNTSVCDIQAMNLNKAAKKLKDVEISVVTVNVPFIVEAFQAKHSLKNISLLSSFNNDTFGKKYGVLVTDGELSGILARSIFVVDKKGTVVYKEITANIDKMPNLEAALEAAEKANRV